MRIKYFTKILMLAAAGILLSVGAARAQSEAENMRLFMDGARLWPVYCSQCHNARPGSEFSPQQWNTIMMHMRTKANMPAKDARAILQYLRGSH
jgi:mono/diheme cytochrome c family protein